MVARLEVCEELTARAHAATQAEARRKRLLEVRQQDKENARVMRERFRRRQDALQRRAEEAVRETWEYARETELRDREAALEARLANIGEASREADRVEFDTLRQAVQDRDTMSDLRRATDARFRYAVSRVDELKRQDTEASATRVAWREKARLRAMQVRDQHRAKLAARYRGVPQSLQPAFVPGDAYQGQTSGRVDSVNWTVSRVEAAGPTGVERAQAVTRASELERRVEASRREESARRAQFRGRQALTRELVLRQRNEFQKAFERLDTLDRQARVNTAVDSQVIARQNPGWFEQRMYRPDPETADTQWIRNEKALARAFESAAPAVRQLRSLDKLVQQSSSASAAAVAAEQPQPEPQPEPQPVPRSEPSAKPSANPSAEEDPVQTDGADAKYEEQVETARPSVQPGIDTQEELDAGPRATQDDDDNDRWAASERKLVRGLQTPKRSSRAPRVEIDEDGIEEIVVAPPAEPVRGSGGRVDVAKVKRRLSQDSATTQDMRELLYQVFDSKLKELKSAWRQIDSDGVGFIGMHAFSQGLADVGLAWLSPENQQQLWTRADSAGTGFVQYETAFDAPDGAVVADSTSPSDDAAAVESVRKLPSTPQRSLPAPAASPERRRAILEKLNRRARDAASSPDGPSPFALEAVVDIGSEPFPAAPEDDDGGVAEAGVGDTGVGEADLSNYLPPPEDDDDEKDGQAYPTEAGPASAAGLSPPTPPTPTPWSSDEDSGYYPVRYTEGELAQDPAAASAAAEAAAGMDEDIELVLARAQMQLEELDRSRGEAGAGGATAEGATGDMGAADADDTLDGIDPEEIERRVAAEIALLQDPEIQKIEQEYRDDLVQQAPSESKAPSTSADLLFTGENDAAALPGSSIVDFFAGEQTNTSLTSSSSALTRDESEWLLSPELALGPQAAATSAPLSAQVERQREDGLSPIREERGRAGRAVSVQVTEPVLFNLVLTKWETLITVWRVLDQKRTGRVDKTEFSVGLRESGLHWLADSQRERLWTLVQPDAQGRINYLEFKRALGGPLDGPPPPAAAKPPRSPSTATRSPGGRRRKKKVRKAKKPSILQRVIDKWETITTVWRVMDQNKDGKISRKEFEHGLQQSGLQLSVSELDKLWARADTESIGYVNYHGLRDVFADAPRPIQSPKKGRKMPLNHVVLSRAKPRGRKTKPKKTRRVKFQN